MHALMCSMLKWIRKKRWKKWSSRSDFTGLIPHVHSELYGFLCFCSFTVNSWHYHSFNGVLFSSEKLWETEKDEYIFKKITCLKKGSMYVFYCLYLVSSCCPCCFCANVVGEISIWPLMQLFCEVLSKNVSTWNKHIWLFFFTYFPELRLVFRSLEGAS